MTTRLPFRWIALTACLWWLGVAIYFIIELQPGPFTPDPFVDWNQMGIVYYVGPWIVVPFAVLTLWMIAVRIRSGSVVAPAWMTWSCGALAWFWMGFAAWRAHDQVFNCVLWAPRELLWTTHCSLPSLMASVSPWLLIPLAAWLVLAAMPLHSPRWMPSTP